MIYTVGILLIMVATLGKLYVNAKTKLAKVALVLEAKEKENAILLKQRDNDITSIVDADRVWESGDIGD